MSLLGWGKCRVFIKDLDAENAVWKELPTPIENTTILETTKGDKQEAKIEGGENEDVRYSKSTYALNLNIRAAKGRNKPIKDSDGIVSHNYAVAVQPEDPEAVGLMMDKSKPSVADTFSTEEGAIWEYVFDALKPESGDQVKMGQVKVTESGGKISDVTIEELTEEE